MTQCTCKRVIAGYQPLSHRRLIHLTHTHIMKTTDGHSYRLNCRYLKTSQAHRSAHSVLTISIHELNDDFQSETTMTTLARLSEPVTSSGRPVKTPTRF